MNIRKQCVYFKCSINNNFTPENPFRNNVLLDQKYGRPDDNNNNNFDIILFTQLQIIIFI